MFALDMNIHSRHFMLNRGVPTSTTLSWTGTVLAGVPARCSTMEASTFPPVTLMLRSACLHLATNLAMPSGLVAFGISSLLI